MRSTIALAILLPAVALADGPSPAEVLQKTDKAMNAFKDGMFESKLRVKQNDGSYREYAFTTYQKVPEKRLVRFSSPGDVKGMGFLVENKETMYVFLPGFQRVRRMGTHVKNQTFMGSDFSFDDMSQTTFGATYEPKGMSQDDKHYVLELKQKAGLDLEFPNLKVWIDKSSFHPTKQEFMDASGKKLKTQIRDGYTYDGKGHHQPGRVLVIDHRRNDHESEIVFSSAKFDSGLPDDLFTQRSLIRGN